MRWVVFAVAALAAVVLDVSFLDGLAPDDARRIHPSAVAILAVFVGLSAPRTTALWAGLLLGLLLDLSYPVQLGTTGVVFLVGPHALGYVAGTYLVVRFRTVVFRQRPLTVGVMTIGLLVLVNIVVIALYIVRTLHPGVAVSWTDTSLAGELGGRLLAALYSGLVAVPIGWLLVRSMPLWSFATPGHRTGQPR